MLSPNTSRWFGLLIVLSLTLSACAPSESTAPSAPDTSAPEAATPDETTTDGGENDAESVGSTAPSTADAEDVATDQDAPTVDDDAAEEPDEPELESIVPLTVGDVAPALAIREWVKGDAVNRFEEGRVYVVEFWATWCGPCRTSMPHLSKLQEEFSDAVTVIGISDETTKKVSQFMQAVQNKETGATWNETITYNIALDDTAQTTNRRYMKGAGQTGIPTSFIVGRDGYVEWIGHPMRMDEPLRRVVDGSWDRAAAKENFEAIKKQKQLAAEIGLAIRSARADNNYDPVFALLDNALQDGLPAALVGNLRLEVLLQASMFEEANRFAEEYAALVWDDANELNEIAWKLATRISRADGQNLDLALKVAERANELSESRNASTLDTIARIYYEKGDLEQAIAWQKRAVAAAPGQVGLERTLESYEKEMNAAKAL